jgi:uncharacterized protein (TIGR01777 family)
MTLKEIILITGASGMISKSLAQLLVKKGYEIRFLTRTKRQENQYKWDISKGFIEKDALINVSHIIHLAGANISEKRWTKSRKNEILDSRVLSTQLLFNEVKKQQINLKTFISASAVGYYGTSENDELFTEDSPNGNDFLANVCNIWEAEANQFLTLQNTRLIKLRFGVVLDTDGGALQKIIKPIKMEFGAALSSGKQFIPWIHTKDLCNLLLFAIENTAMNGVYNAVAPEHLNNEQITKLIAKKLDKKLWLPNAPAFVLKLLLGEMASIVLKGNRISADKLLSTGFQFKFPTIKKALDNLIP